MSTPSSPFWSPYSFVSLCRPLQPMLLLSLFRYCTQIHPVNSAKYLRTYITANGSSVADCNYRFPSVRSLPLALSRLYKSCSAGPTAPSNLFTNCYGNSPLWLWVVSHKFTLSPKSPDLTPSTTKFSDKSSKLKALSTTGSCNPLMRNVQTLSFFNLLTFIHLVSWSLVNESQFNVYYT